MIGEQGEIEGVVEECDTLVLKVPSESDSVKKFEVISDINNETFQLKNLQGAEEKHFVTEIFADKTYLKTIDGKFIAFNKEQNRVIEKSNPCLEVAGRCFCVQLFQNSSSEGIPDWILQHCNTSIRSIRFCI